MPNHSQMLASARRIFEGAEKNLPRNEQETLQRVVLPLLRELAGYNPEEDFYYEHSSLAGRADIYYPAATPQDALWIEVKDWNTPLDDKHAVQLVNYVNTQGGRWGVLTNGREWRLYDCHLTHLPAQDRLVLRAHKDDLQSIVDFMQVIGKNAVNARQVETSLRPLRLVNLLEGLVMRPSPSHPLFPLIREAIQKEFPNLGDAELVGAFCKVVRRIAQSISSASSTTSENTFRGAVPPSDSSHRATLQSALPESTEDLLNHRYSSWIHAWVTFVQYYYRVDSEKLRNYLKAKGDFYTEPRRARQSGTIRTMPLNDKEHFYRYRGREEIQERLREIASLFGLSGKQIQVRGEVFTL